MASSGHALILTICARSASGTCIAVRMSPPRHRRRWCRTWRAVCRGALVDISVAQFRRCTSHHHHPIAGRRLTVRGRERISPLHRPENSSDWRCAIYLLESRPGSTSRDEWASRWPGDRCRAEDRLTYHRGRDALFAPGSIERGRHSGRYPLERGCSSCAAAGTRRSGRPDAGGPAAAQRVEACD